MLLIKPYATSLFFKRQAPQMILFSLYRLFPDKPSAKPRSNRQLQIKIPTKLDRISLKSRRAQNAAVKE
jgi:hypothetical protein